MQKFATALVCLALVLPALAQDALQQGIEWFNRRAEGAVGLRARPEPIDQAIPYFQAAMSSPRNELSSGLYLIRSYIHKGRFVEQERQAQKRTLEKAVKTAEELVKKYPNSPELRFEYISALGLWGDKMGVIEAAKAGIVDRLMDQNAILLKMDPEFKNSVGKRTEAIMNYRVPKIPFILSWPDKKKAVTMLKDIFTRYPNDPVNVYYYGEALVENGEHEQAKDVLKRVMAIQPDPEYLLEHRAMHEEAKKMLDRLNSK